MFKLLADVVRSMLQSRASSVALASALLSASFIMSADILAWFGVHVSDSSASGMRTLGLFLGGSVPLFFVIAILKKPD